MSLGRALPRGEGVRKLVHAGMAAFALVLPWLTWRQAALCAAAAVVFNWVILPRVVGHRLTSERGDVSDRGVMLYPLVVLGLIVVFRDRLALAALGWGILAFGDAAAGVVGMKWGQHALAWNRRKSVEGLAAFLVAGAAGGGLLYGWYEFHVRSAVLLHGSGPVRMVLTWCTLVIFPLLLAGILESLPHGLDDNVLPPFLVPTFAALAWYGPEVGVHAPILLAVGVNSACAAAALIARALRPGGVAVAWALGVGVWMVGGWRSFVLLLCFLMLGLGVTFLGFGRKARAGVAEGHGGRRGFVEVFGKGGVLLVLCLTALVAQIVRSHFTASWAVVAILAAATADTWGTEVGGLLGRRAFTLVPFREVRPGTPGAVSWEGVAGGAVGAALIVAVAGPLGLLGAAPLLTGAICLSSAVVAALVESLLPALGPADHTGKNLAVTFITVLFSYFALGVLA